MANVRCWPGCLSRTPPRNVPRWRLASPSCPLLPPHDADACLCLASAACPAPQIHGDLKASPALQPCSTVAQPAARRSLHWARCTLASAAQPSSCLLPRVRGCCCPEPAFSPHLPCLARAAAPAACQRAAEGRTQRPSRLCLQARRLRAVQDAGGGRVARQHAGEQGSCGHAAGAPPAGHVWQASAGLCLPLRASSLQPTRPLRLPHLLQSYGTASYAAPELLAQGKLTKAADVYSLGILMWEAVAAAEPYADLTAMQVILQASPAAVVPPSGRQAGPPPLLLGCCAAAPHACPAMRPAVPLRWLPAPRQ